MSNPLIGGMEPGIGKASAIFGLSAVAYGMEYVGASHVKSNYQGMYTGGWQTKSGVSAYKAIMYGLMLSK